MKVTYEDFKVFYEERLESLLKEFDAEISEFKATKKPEKRNYNILSIVSFVIISLIAVYLLRFSEDHCIYTGVLGLFVAGMFQYFRLGISNEWVALQKRIQKSYKVNIIGEICHHYFQRFKYIPHQHISKKSIRSSLLYDFFMIFYSGEDYFQFIIDDVVVQFSEFTYSLDKRPIYHNSLFVSASFPKYFQGQTIVTPEFHARSGMREKSLKGSLVNPQRELNKVHLEKSDFEDDFIVRSDSQVESRKILSPSLMQKLVDYRRNKKRNIALSFLNNKMYMRIESDNDYFEPKLEKGSNADPEFIYEELSILTDITDMVQELSLNEKIWKV